MKTENTFFNKLIVTEKDYDDWVKHTIQRKLNLGCGTDYKEDWINLDFNKEVKMDVCYDLNVFPYPFKDSSFDLILIDNVLEHIKDAIIAIDEIWRIAKAGAIIEIFVPHFSGIYATKHFAHYHQFGIGSFDIYKEVSGLSFGFNKERYGAARFKILTQKLIFFHHKGAELKFLSKLPINWIFNLSRSWQLFWEKFTLLKFDEIYYKLEVIKEK